jgi:hypothetical protein
MSRCSGLLQRRHLLWSPQVLEMLKALLDPETLEASAEKDKFVELFYDKHVGALLAALVAAGEAPGGAPPPSANTGALLGVHGIRGQQLRLERERRGGQAGSGFMWG